MLLPQMGGSQLYSIGREVQQCYPSANPPSIARTSSSVASG